ncbi:MAG: hypothetical protein QOE00_2053 [Ilumatobacteraceae bacterium]
MPRSTGPSLRTLSRMLAGESQNDADRSLEQLRVATAGVPNPSKPDDVVALRIWLNAWACRIPYPRDGADLLAASLDGWWRTHRSGLPDGPLRDVDDRGIDDLAGAYDDLARLPAGLNRQGHVRSLAPTATSKLLWVLRPHTACPWDMAIAKAGGQGSELAGYANHLRKARAWSRQITDEATARGIDDVPAHVGRPTSTLVKVYDEWCYLSITRGMT